MIWAGFALSATALKWLTIGKIALAAGECAISAGKIVKSIKNSK